MPWLIEQQGDRYCVVKEGGAVVACHATRSRALRHQRALYANEPAARTKATRTSTGESSGGSGYSARAGEVIRGNLARGGDGKFTSAGNASAAKPKPTTPAADKPATTGRRAVDLGKRSAKPPKGRAAAKPKKGPKGPDPAKAAERAKRRAEAAAKRAQREMDKKQRAQEAQQKKLDRAVANEMKRREQLSKRDQAATDRAKRQAERAAKRAAAEAKRQAAAQKPKAGGGKGGSGKKPAAAKKPEAATPDKAVVAAENRTRVGQALGVDTTALAKLADGTQPDSATATALAAAGLMSRNRDGSYSTTPSGRAVLNAAERGDERQARAMLARGRDMQAGRDEQQARTEARARDRASRRRKSFAVFKDHSGRLRWLAVSSTAFQDRDGEIVSVQALKDDVARSDATGQYGPLRFWHVPGLDIGDCDFRAVHGRSLIESGTFRDDRYAAIVKDGDQVSLGFLHTLDQPTPDKIFESIHTFERSVTPAGRASNPFTRLTIQEVQMLTKEKQDELASRVGPDILEALLAQVSQTEKTADEAGVRHKSVERVAVWDEATGAWSEVTTKAPDEEAMVAEADDLAAADAELDADAAVDEAAEGYFTPEELAEITAAVAPAVAAAVIEQLGPMLNMEAKMSKFTDELKSLVMPQLAQKDAALAEQAQALAATKAQAEALDTRLKALEGDQPRGAGYRPSEVKETIVGEQSALKQAQPTVDPNFVQFFSFGQ